MGQLYIKQTLGIRHKRVKTKNMLHVPQKTKESFDEKKKTTHKF